MKDRIKFQNTVHVNFVHQKIDSDGQNSNGVFIILVDNTFLKIILSIRIQIMKDRIKFQNTVHVNFVHQNLDFDGQNRDQHY